MAVSLIASLVCLALWVTMVFIRPVGLGIVHILLALAAVLWVRWWARKGERFRSPNSKTSPLPAPSPPPSR